jgi:hypothetical protein
MWLSILSAECYPVGKQAAMDSCEISARPLQCGSVLKYSLALLGFGEIELRFPSVTATFLGIAHHLVAKHSISPWFHHEPVAVMGLLTYSMEQSPS